MKKIFNRTMAYISLIIIFTTLGIIGYKNKPHNTPKKEILNTTYYKYNTEIGTYEELKINEKDIYYKGETLNLNSCKNYEYDKKTETLKLDCNKSFKIISSLDDMLVIEINNQNNYLYKDKEKSLSGEFQRKFGLSIDAYKISGETYLKEIEIDTKKLTNILKKQETSFIYIKGNNCNLECTLFNKELNKFSSTDNIYYLDIDKLKNEDLEEINNLNNSSLTIEELNKDYPQVLIIQNQKIKELLKIEGNGFNYSKYHNYDETLEVEE